MTTLESVLERLRDSPYRHCYGANISGEETRVNKRLGFTECMIKVNWNTEHGRTKSLSLPMWEIPINMLRDMPDVVVDSAMISDPYGYKVLTIAIRVYHT